MPSLIEEPTPSLPVAQPVATEYLTADGQPNVALLQDRTPAWLRASRRSVALAAVLGGLFVFFSFLPLSHTDVWGHLSYGRWMVQNGRLPATEPLMPLAQGVPMVDTAWLTQLAGYEMVTRFGNTGLQFLYALSITLISGLLAAATLRRTGSLSAALLALGVFLVGSSWHLWVARPQLAGMICFAGIFLAVAGPAWSRWKTWAIPLTFLLWANLHGSFIVGLVLLGLLIVGRAVDISTRTGRWDMVVAEGKLRGLVIALELSLAVVLINPYGVTIYPEVLAFAGNPNLASLYEWDPLTLRMRQGQTVAAVLAALLLLYRVTPRRVRFEELTVLTGLAAAMFWHSRMIVWFMPVAGYYLALHAIAVWRARSKAAIVESPRATGLYSVVLLGVAWIAFAITPFGSLVMHGPPADPQVAAARQRRSLGDKTPVEVTRFLVENPPAGLIYNTYEWGDYFQWAGPAGLQVFVNSHAHLVPQEVWEDYFVIGRGLTGWEEKLDRYGVSTVAVDTEHSASLIRLLEKNEKWALRYRDGQGAVFSRKSLN